MTAATPTPTPAVTPHEELTIRLWPERPRIEQLIVDQIEALAPQLATLSTAQLRGLVNALATGPARRTVAERRRALAYFLAWRHTRAQKIDLASDDAEPSSSTAWVTAADQLADALATVEAESTAVMTDLETHQQVPFVAQYQVEFTMTILEEFIHRLIRHVISNQAAPAQATSSPTSSTTEGDSHEQRGLSPT